jgi:hypothetical protein
MFSSPAFSERQGTVESVVIKGRYYDRVRRLGRSDRNVLSFWQRGMLLIIGYRAK